MNKNEMIVKTFKVKMAENNIKQKDIAKDIGISTDRLSRILSLKSKMLAEEMLKLCFVLNVNPNDLRKSA